MYKKLYLIIAMVALVCQSTWALTQTQAEKLKALVDSKQFKEAYQFAKPLQSNEEGDPTFDFYFGISAMHTGQLKEAEFALERVLVNQPKNHRARLELGLLHVKRADFDLAKKEFDKVLNVEPPPNVRDNISRILAQIAAFQSRPKQAKKDHQFWGYLRTNMGFDSNINSGTINDFIDIPAGRVLLDNSAIQTEGLFGEVQVAVGLLKLITPSFNFYGQLSALDRNNIANHRFDVQSYAFNGGFNYTDGTYQLTIPLYANRFVLANNTFRDTYSAGAELHKTLDKNNKLIFFATQSSLVYAEDAQSAQQTLGGISWSHVATDIQTVFANKIYHALQTVRSTSDFNGKMFSGAEVYAQFVRWKTVKPYALVNIQVSKHLEPNPALTIHGIKRKDRLATYGIGLSWQTTKNLALTTDYRHLDNRSNFELYRFRRHMAQVGFFYRTTT